MVASKDHWLTNTFLIRRAELIGLPGVRIAGGVEVIKIKRGVLGRLVGLDEVAAGAQVHIDTVEAIAVGLVGSECVVVINNQDPGVAVVIGRIRYQGVVRLQTESLRTVRVCSAVDDRVLSGIHDYDALVKGISNCDVHDLVATGRRGFAETLDYDVELKPRNCAAAEDAVVRANDQDAEHPGTHPVQRMAVKVELDIAGHDLNAVHWTGQILSNVILTRMQDFIWTSVDLVNISTSAADQENETAKNCQSDIGHR